MSSVPWKDVISVRPVGDYKVALQFSDGAEGVVDIATLVEFRGVFAELSNPEIFARVRVDSECGTICWPGGADISPEALYSAALSAGPRLPAAPKGF